MRKEWETADPLSMGTQELSHAQGFAPKTFPCSLYLQALRHMDRMSQYLMLQEIQMLITCDGANSTRSASLEEGGLPRAQSTSCLISSSTHSTFHQKPEFAHAQFEAQSKDSPGENMLCMTCREQRYSKNRRKHSWEKQKRRYPGI